MFDLETIRAVNKRAAVFKQRKLAKAMNNPGGHAKDAEKGRKIIALTKWAR